MTILTQDPPKSNSARLLDQSRNIGKVSKNLIFNHLLILS